MTDSLNELSRILKGHRQESSDALKRLHKKKYKIERVVDMFDPTNSFRMDFFKGRGLTNVNMDLYFKPPPAVACCAGDYCSLCQIFNAGEEFLQLEMAYISGSVTMRINGREFLNFTETNPDQGTVTINAAVPVGAVVRVCFIAFSTATTFSTPTGGGTIGGSPGDPVPPPPPPVSDPPPPGEPPPPPPTNPPPVSGGGVIRQFPGSGSNSQAAFEAMMADMSIDTIEIAAGTYFNWHINSKSLSRKTRPLLVRPAPNAAVIWDDTGGGTGTTGFLAFGALFGPGTPTVASDYITFDSRGTGGSFTIRNYNLGSFGLIYLGWFDHLQFNGFTIRNCSGTGGLSHSLYVASDDVHTSTNLVANDWNIAGSPNLTGFQTYHQPNVNGFVAQNWMVDNVWRAAYIWANAKNVTVNGWTINNTARVFDTYETSTGVISNCHSINGGVIAPGKGDWLNLNILDGGGNSPTS